MYDGHVLDILEFGLENYKSLQDFKGAQPAAGGKPCFYICGDEWDSTPLLATAKNFLIGEKNTPLYYFRLFIERGQSH